MSFLGSKVVHILSMVVAPCKAASCKRAKHNEDVYIRSSSIFYLISLKNDVCNCNNTNKK